MASASEKNPPAILVLLDVIRDFETANDPEGLGKLLFPLAAACFGDEYTPPKSGGDLNTFNRLLEAAKAGIESFEKRSERGKKGAAGKIAKSQTANPSPSGVPAPVAACPRPFPSPSKPEPVRRGGVKPIGDFLSVIMGGGLAGGCSMADRIRAEPVKTALEITHETGSKLAENTLKKYYRVKGHDAFCDELSAFESELRQGEEPDNRGKAFNARLAKLPDIHAGK